MLRLTSLANKYQRRTLRVLYGQTQAYPYAAKLASTFDRTAGALTGGGAITGVKAAIIPGLVAVKQVGETVTLAGAGGTTRPFGLFANFVGGQMDEIGSGNDIGVWRGPDSVYEVLAPAFDDTGLAALAAAEDGAVGNEVYLKSNAKGQLVGASGTTGVAAGNVGRLVQRLSSKAIVIELLV